MGTEYNLIESTGGYVPRTYENVRDSDGTMRLCVDFYSAGEICTMKAIKKYNKPWFDVYLLNPPDIQHCVDWIFTNNIKILNIAGNTQWKRDEDVYKYSTYCLQKLFNQLKEQG